MGPPLKGWREFPAVNRHGETADVEMLTQVVEKAPKWTFAIGRDMAKPVLAPTSPTLGPGAPGNAELAKYKKTPSYSLGMRRERKQQTGMPLYGRPKESQPVGGQFSRVPRKSPFEAQPGSPGPHSAPKVPAIGPTFSFGPLHAEDKGGNGNPSPAQYRPRPEVTQRAAPGGRWAQSSAASPLRPQTVGPGPSLLHGSLGAGPKYSLGPRHVPAPEDHRQLGPPYTQFGYDDFGHSRQDEHATYFFKGHKPSTQPREAARPQEATRRPGTARAGGGGAATVRAPGNRPQSQQLPRARAEGTAEAENQLTAPAVDDRLAGTSQMLPHPM